MLIYKLISYAKSRLGDVMITQLQGGRQLLTVYSWSSRAVRSSRLTARWELQFSLRAAKCCRPGGVRLLREKFLTLHRWSMCLCDDYFMRRTVPNQNKRVKRIASHGTRIAGSLQRDSTRGQGWLDKKLRNAYAFKIIVLGNASKNNYSLNRGYLWYQT